MQHFEREDRGLKGKQAEPSPGTDRDRATAPEDRLEASRAIVCRRCETEVSSARHIFAPLGESAIAAYANPSGHLREVLAVREAWSLDLQGWSTSDFTWFPGYAWRIAHCAGCATHVGWCFEAEGTSEPPRFFGLLTAAVVER
ncbi:MAG: hypothetical protein IT384_31500 [Deltaproteobacteria bacterium]|nr:hypothetical protein [Deltaproteobacteria bacterium]